MTKKIEINDGKSFDNVHERFEEFLNKDKNERSERAEINRKKIMDKYGISATELYEIMENNGIEELEQQELRDGYGFSDDYLSELMKWLDESRIEYSDVYDILEKYGLSGRERWDKLDDIIGSQRDKDQKIIYLLSTCKNKIDEANKVIILKAKEEQSKKLINFKYKKEKKFLNEYIKNFKRTAGMIIINYLSTLSYNEKKHFFQAMKEQELSSFIIIDDLKPFGKDTQELAKQFIEKPKNSD